MARERRTTRRDSWLWRTLSSRSDAGRPPMAVAPLWLSADQLAERSAGARCGAAARAARSRAGHAALGRLNQQPAIAAEGHLDGLARAAADEGLQVDVSLHRALHVP